MGWPTKYTGEIMDSTLEKGRQMKTSNNGWIRMQSSESKPTDLNNLKNTGNYITEYWTNGPDILVNTKIKPVNITVNDIGGILYQFLSVREVIFSRQILENGTATPWIIDQSNGAFTRGTTAPTNPVDGKTLWLDSSDSNNAILKLYINGNWVEIRSKNIMKKSVYDPQGKATDIYEYIEKAINKGNLDAGITDMTDYSKHIQDSSIHITEDELTTLKNLPTTETLKERTDEIKSGIKTSVETVIGTDKTKYETVTSSMKTLNDKYTTHTTDTTIHPTNENRKKWNSKADKNHVHRAEDHTVKISYDKVTGGLPTSVMPYYVKERAYKINSEDELKNITKNPYHSGDVFYKEAYNTGKRIFPANIGELPKLFGTDNEDSPAELLDVVYTGNKYIAIFDGWDVGTICHSIDGLNWTLTKPEFYDLNNEKIVLSSAMHLYMGSVRLYKDGIILFCLLDSSDGNDNRYSSLFYSNDLVKFDLITPQVMDIYNYAIAPNKIITLEKNNEAGADQRWIFKYSTDQITWTDLTVSSNLIDMLNNETAPPPDPIIRYLGNNFVIYYHDLDTCENKQYAYSSDASSWNICTIPDTITNFQYISFVYCNGSYVLYANLTNEFSDKNRFSFRVYYSKDLLNWNEITFNEAALDPLGHIRIYGRPTKSIAVICRYEDLDGDDYANPIIAIYESIDGIHWVKNKNSDNLIGYMMDINGLFPFVDPFVQAEQQNHYNNKVLLPLLIPNYSDIILFDPDEDMKVLEEKENTWHLLANDSAVKDSAEALPSIEESTTPVDFGTTKYWVMDLTKYGNYDSYYGVYANNDSATQKTNMFITSSKPSLTNWTTGLNIDTSGFTTQYYSICRYFKGVILIGQDWDLKYYDARQELHDPVSSSYISGSKASLLYTDDNIALSFNNTGASSSLYHYSTDGINWSEGNLPAFGRCSDVCYGNGKYVVLQQAGGTYFYSTDAMKWTQGTIPTTIEEWKYIAYANGMFVYIVNNTSSRCYYSSDAITWTEGTLPYRASWDSICGSDNVFVLMSQDYSEGNFNIVYSYDGITWIDAKDDLLGYRAFYPKAYHIEDNKFLLYNLYLNTNNTGEYIWSPVTITFPNNVTDADKAFIKMETNTASDLLVTNAVNKPTTMEGYGITNLINKSAAETKVNEIITTAKSRVGNHTAEEIAKVGYNLQVLNFANTDLEEIEMIFDYLEKENTALNTFASYPEPSLATN